jgi:hypothetical protein
LWPAPMTSASTLAGPLSGGIGDLLFGDLG